MAKRKKEKIEQQFSYKSSINWLWILMALIATGGVVAHVFTMFYEHWRVAGPIVYTYKYADSRLNHHVGEVKYGLMRIVYDKDSVYQSWDGRVQISKIKAAAAEQVGRQPTGGSTLNIWSSMCPPPCQEAVTTRANLYDTMRTTNLILLAGLALSAAIALGAVAWMLLIGNNFLVQLSCWMLAAVFSLCVGAFWIYQTDIAWKRITATQQIPYPSVGICWYIFLCGCAMYGVAALGSYFCASIDRYGETKARDKELAQQLLEQQYSGFPGQPGGMHMSQQAQGFSAPGAPWNPFERAGGSLRHSAMTQRDSQQDRYSIGPQVAIPPNFPYAGAPGLGMPQMIPRGSGSSDIYSQPQMSPWMNPSQPPSGSFPWRMPAQPPEARSSSGASYSYGMPNFGR
ncbi:hypothetical protein IE077_002088 [Cardiosporidium cionae]|uniref:Uncharacterized protein n=1 Tax=Cardiosporidium cionae TaxID=476202 RepID=A0ABQ7JBS2_9APIC|nr:hypothetical protein IE077_002088 [Cardiosporidium cionae]|eukprot:KAF8821385.1 hypothetical protein IE077_002088 [Cardiosporidium cionae]